MSVTHALLSATSRSTSAWTRARALSLCRRYFGTSKRSSSTRCDSLYKKRISVYIISVSLYAYYRSSDRLKSEPRTLEYWHIYIAQSVERIHNPVPILKGFLFSRMKINGRNCFAKNNDNEGACRHTACIKENHIRKWQAYREGNKKRYTFNLE